MEHGGICCGKWEQRPSWLREGQRIRTGGSALQSSGGRVRVGRLPVAGACFDVTHILIFGELAVRVCSAPGPKGEACGRGNIDSDTGGWKP